MMWEYNGHGWGMGWWWIIGLIVLSVIIWIVAKSMSQDTAATRHPEKTALDILKERYAKGEIDKKEFEERRKDLSQ
ncbi:MAG: SHOCT domain-containing protein [Bacteroidales bacterium]